MCAPISVTTSNTLITANALNSIFISQILGIIAIVSGIGMSLKKAIKDIVS